MSVNWHYFKAMNRRPTTTIPKAATGNIKDLYGFTNYKADTRQYGQTGRSWRAEELRLKHHDDLHKQLSQMFYGYSELVKVRLSMARLLTVVNERKKVRNEYRKHLEDEYIAKKKAEEQEALAAEGDRLREKGIKAPLTDAQTKELLIKKSAAKQEALKNALEMIKDASEKQDITTAPTLNEGDLKLLSTT